MICYKAGTRLISNFRFIAVSNMAMQVFLRVLYYFEMVDKILQGVIDSFDVGGCNCLLQVQPQLQAIVMEV